MTLLLAQNYAARTESLAEIRTVVHAATLSAGGSETCADETVLAVNEACMNILQHGYHFAAGQRFRIEIAKEGRVLEILLCDNGEEATEDKLKPRALDDVRPGGLGVHFIRELTDTIAYLPPTDAWRNRLQITKLLV